MKNYEGKTVFPLFMFFDDYESGNVLGSHSGAIPKIEVNLDFLIQLHSQVSYVPKKKRSVVLLSSLHRAAEIDENTNEIRKSSIVTFYNKTKGGVDEIDKKVKIYSTSRKNKIWPLTLFFPDIAGINAMVILRANNVSIRKMEVFTLKTNSVHEALN